MKTSTERILTTHTGSLPRPDDLVQMMFDKEEGQVVDPARLEERIRSALAEVVKKQVDAGVDVVSDGEVGKPGYSNYVKDRLTGFEGQGGLRSRAERDDYPEYFARMRQDAALMHLKTPVCSGPVKLKDPGAVQRDIASFRTALQALGQARPADAFMTAASPGVIAHFLENRY